MCRRRTRPLHNDSALDPQFIQMRCIWCDGVLLWISQEPHPGPLWRKYRVRRLDKSYSSIMAPRARKSRSTVMGNVSGQDSPINAATCDASLEPATACRHGPRTCEGNGYWDWKNLGKIWCALNHANSLYMLASPSHHVDSPIVWGSTSIIFSNFKKWSWQSQRFKMSRYTRLHFVDSDPLPTSPHPQGVKLAPCHPTCESNAGCVASHHFFGRYRPDQSTLHHKMPMARWHSKQHSSGCEIQIGF